MSKLIIAEPPLQVLPSLAVAIGLNEAIIVQQIHYWVVGKSGKVIDGQRWIYNGYREWKEQFPFWSEDTIQRAFRSAEKQGVIVSQHQKGFDRRKLYRVDYEALDNLILQSSNTASCGDGQPQNADIRTPQDAVMLTETTENSPETTKQKDDEESAPKFSKSFLEYERNIGALVPMLKEELDKLIAETSEAAVLHGITQAVGANARNLRYIAACARTLHSGADVARGRSSGIRATSRPTRMSASEEWLQRSENGQG